MINVLINNQIKRISHRLAPQANLNQIIKRTMQSAAGGGSKMPSNLPKGSNTPSATANSAANQSNASSTLQNNNDNIPPLPMENIVSEGKNHDKFSTHGDPTQSAAPKPNTAVSPETKAKLDAEVKDMMNTKSLKPDKENTTQVDAIRSPEGIELIDSARDLKDSPSIRRNTNDKILSPSEDDGEIGKVLAKAEERGIIKYGSAGQHGENNGVVQLTPKGIELMAICGKTDKVSYKNTASDDINIALESDTQPADTGIALESDTLPDDSENHPKVDLISLCVNDETIVPTPAQQHLCVVVRDQKDIPGEGLAIGYMTSEKGTKKGLSGLAGPKNTYLGPEQVSGNEKSQYVKPLYPPYLVKASDSEVAQGGMAFFDVRPEKDFQDTSIDLEDKNNMVAHNIESSARLAEIESIYKQAKTMVPVPYSPVGYTVTDIQDAFIVDDLLNSSINTQDDNNNNSLDEDTIYHGEVD